MTVSLTRTVAFRATHHLRLDALTDAENRARFGGAVDPHAHDYRLSATVSGPPMPGIGSVIDLAQLDAILRQEVITPFEGTSLNASLPAVAAGTALPVCETIAAWCFERIAARLPTGVRLDRVRVAEDNTLHADCTGPA